jgi:transporter family protein
MWIALALLSSFILGIYDILKKISLRDNLAIRVLYLSSIFGALLFVPLLFLSKWNAGFTGNALFIPGQNLQAHLFFFLKSVVVGSSWIFAYFAIKHLPVTVVSTIRSSGPVWTVFGATVIFHEKLNFIQWLGILSAVFFYYLFASFGNKENKTVTHKKWIIFAVIATLLGSISSLYDKYLIASFNRMAVQAWFSIYMPVFFLPFILFEKRYLSIKGTHFKWRWSIPLIGISLVLADFAYFLALDQDGSLISLVSALRRVSVVFTFILAGMFLGEHHLKKRFLVLIGILASVVLIIYGTHA